MRVKFSRFYRPIVEIANPRCLMTHRLRSIQAATLITFTLGLLYIVVQGTLLA